MNSSVTDAEKSAEKNNHDNAEQQAVTAASASTSGGDAGAQVSASPNNPQSSGEKNDGRGAARKRGGRRHNRSGRAEGAAQGKPETKNHHQDAGAGKGQNAAAPRRQNAALLQLAQLYPQLFGDQPKPLKRGIFQDLEAAHAGVFEPADLKLALGIHTRSSRYLQAVSQGLPRHDLQGNVVEQMAPEHVFHALVEVFRRRKPRDGEDLTQKLRRRIAMAFEASGLTREAYLELVRGRDDATNALLDEALAEVAARNAKDEALLRAFEASGAANVEAFADMYGMVARNVAQQLDRARRLRG